MTMSPAAFCAGTGTANRRVPTFVVTEEEGKKKKRKEDSAAGRGLDTAAYAAPEGGKGEEGRPTAGQESGRHALPIGACVVCRRPPRPRAG